ncbi:Vps51/Vps67 domain-containing protein, partial [Mycena amicta]
MSRRPSVLSISSPGPLPNGSVKLVQSPIAPDAKRRPSVAKIPDPPSEMDPDALFTKYTIAEVKFAKEKLRADADAKQEELRLMVGERYRDLLQASTSYRRVIEALEEAKDAILSQSAPPLRQRMSSYAGGDPHLHALQILSAHVKLLLDAQEYLWRLIERKKYFTAAWLFLLARVVHRALVRDDDQEETWNTERIDVLEQFPLVQRQWEAVSQFRSQIIYRAGESLKEYAASSEDVCAALLTLHLLDSRPLSETLSSFLDHRFKTFSSLLRASENPPATPPSPISNGYIVHTRLSRKASVREVREAMQTALDAMVKTMASARDVFEEADSKQSMIRNVLEFIQSDSVHSSFLPPELQLTTQSLLETLPSSTHFLLLPSTLRSYRPYVDLTSSSASVNQTDFKRLLDDWFRTSNQKLQAAVSAWLLELHTVAEVWSLGATIRQWIVVSGLPRIEVDTLLTLFDEAAQRRVLDIWNLELSDAGSAFHIQLSSATAKLREAPKERRKDASPINFLFDSPPLPVLTGLAPGDSSFQKYKAALCRQLIGRTVLLDSVLGTLENCARSIQRDISVVLGKKDAESRRIATTLSERRRPDAESACKTVIQTLSSALEAQEKDENELAIDSLMFVGRVADELASSSSFFADIGCGSEVTHDNRRVTRALHDRIIDRWRTLTISRLVRRQRDSFHPLPKSLSIVPSAPSSALFESLLTLSTSLQELGLSRSQQNREADKALRLFVQEWVADDWKQGGAQALCDIAFLRRLVDLRTPEWEDVCQLLDAKAEQLRQEHANRPTENGWRDRSGDQLGCTQTILAALLPAQSRMRTAETSDKSAALLPFGAPPDQPFESLLEFGDQATRFGMLLVETSAH